MKKITLLLLLLITGAINAQIVNIPDADFKYYLAHYNYSNYSVIDTNGDGEIQLSEAEAVQVLTIVIAFGYNDEYQIHDLTGLEAFVNLTELSFYIDTLMTPIPLDLSPFSQLQAFHSDSTFYTMYFASITLGNLPNLTYFDFWNSSVPSLDFSGCPNLVTFDSQGAAVDSIDMGVNLSLTTFHLIVATHINYVNLGGCPNLNSTEISREYFQGEPDGDCYINLRNSNPNNNALVADNYDINSEYAYSNTYVCIDEGEDLEIRGIPLSDFLALSNPALTAPYMYVSNYCSFTPPGSYNTISGTVTLDANNNGCSSGGIVRPVAININNGTSTTKIYNSSTGNYSYYNAAGTYTLTPHLENSSLFSTDAATVTFTNNDGSTATQNFCLTPNGVHNDVEVAIAPIVSARPGFDATYKILYRNKGNQTLSGDVTFTYNDAVLDYVSSTVTPNIASGNLSWNYSNLLPFESREIVVTLNVNSPMETPAVNNDDVLNFTTTVTPVSGDETPDDNTFALKQTVVGSYDPNDITCLEGATVLADKIGDYLHYNINFENTGTAPASFVVVKDIIDETKFDVSSLVVLNTSHAVEARVTGNKVEFYFGDINLAANGGKGNVTFKIKSLETLAVNSNVTQKADIFFDYNWPIETNEATTTYALLNAPGFTKDASVKIYPNPAKNIVSISSESAIQSVQLFDVQGRLLEASSVNNVAASLDIASRANGIYFIKITTENGMKVEKLVKE
ncbi:T9SS type A sorting domain-containing protein [Flavobacterium sp. RHBU_24]|uniref:T9SS type A sorting domain-containing protein n=1 Tax=Flavobacterium sp. RHBU_24 TaxID=3391185 RepID=UPI003984FCD3